MTKIISAGNVPNVVDVFLIAGQSNAAGTGTGFPTRQALLNPKGIIYSGSSGVTVFPITPANTLVKLCALETTEGALNNRGHGIELNLCFQYNAYFGKPCIVMKETEGSTSLNVDWAAASALRASLINRANALTSYLTSIGKTWTIRGFYWNQWEGDSDTLVYKTNLENFISNLRSTINGFDNTTKVCACRPSSSYLIDALAGTRTNRRTSIETASVTNYDYLNQDDLYYVQPEFPGAIHADSYSQNLLAERFLIKVFPGMTFI